MTTALYRRYRPENFAEVIGQEHVTGPLRQALRSGQVNHAYLFSGPRGCGKTSSARILARILNCVENTPEHPTDTPCGVCDSCVELSRGGPGSLDVVEIDAASHGGVDDARELRERATFAPARDRFKIFILDEAHMVTPQGFNALLKIVEEPPPHVKFVFATTEPDKVIGTIRSRTHHYPFRLVPPDVLIAYLGQLCTTEGVTVGSGVLPLVVRAGAGSVRDALSVLDQLVAGSGPAGIDYEGAVALLGYTHVSLLDDLVGAFTAGDGASAFRVVERVISTGHEPRRFVEDLLERIRDLIVISASGEAAGAVFRELPTDQLAAMRVQASHLGAAELSRAADLVNDALREMTGATSPRLHLELLVARLLLPSADDGAAGFGARLDRLERGGRAAGVPTSAPDAHGAGDSKADVPPTAGAALAGPTPVAGGRGAAAVRAALGTTSTGPRPESGPTVAPAPAPAPATPAPASHDEESVPPRAPRVRSTEREAGRAPQSVEPDGDASGAGTTTPVAAALVSAAPVRTTVAPTTVAATTVAATTAAEVAWPEVAEPGVALSGAARPGSAEPAAVPVRTSSLEPVAPRTEPQVAPRAEDAAEDTTAPSPARPDPVGTEPSEPRSSGRPGTETEVLRRRWPEVLETLKQIRRVSWLLVSQNAQVADLDATTLRLSFAGAGAATAFRNGPHATAIEQAVRETLGFDVRVEGVLDEHAGTATSAARPRAASASAPDAGSVAGPQAPSAAQGAAASGAGSAAGAGPSGGTHGADRASTGRVAPPVGAAPPRGAVAEARGSDGIPDAEDPGDLEWGGDDPRDGPPVVSPSTVRASRSTSAGDRPAGPVGGQAAGPATGARSAGSTLPPSARPGPERESSARPAGGRPLSARKAGELAYARAEAARRAAAVVEDSPSPDDPDLAVSGLTGAPLVAQMLGGTVIDEQLGDEV